MPALGNPHDPANPTTPIESRRTLRTMLLDARAALPDRIAHDAALAHHLAGLLNTLPVKRLAAYWPTQGEFDALTVLDHWLAADATRHALLPVGLTKFRHFSFGDGRPIVK